MTGDPSDATVVDARASVLAGGASAAAVIRGGGSWEDATDAVLDELDPAAAVDLALVFVDSRFADHYQDILSRLYDHLLPARVVGCSGQAVIGPAREAEDEPGIAVMTMRLPGADLTPVTLRRGPNAREQLYTLLETDPSALLIFADPFTVQPERLIDVIEERAPDLPLFGGMASSHAGNRGTAVFLDGEVHPAGAVLLAIGGRVEVRTLVAQGAEPIGEPWTITDCEQNLVRTIGNRPAVDVLRDTLATLDPDTRERAQRNLLVGLAIDEYRDEFGRGDFLIRNLLGFDAETGAIAINANVRMGQTLQFQFRDAVAADADLRLQLDALRERLAGRTPLGAVLCTCNGRGRALFDAPDHDARAIAESLGALPTAGLFCNGEIGPVGGKPFLHGFTASIGLFLTAADTEAGADEGGEPAEV